MERVSTAVVDRASASRPMHAGEESGDSFLVRALPEAAMVAVVDGLGHGPEAAVTAREAIGLLADPDCAHPMTALARCHEGLRASRGVVLSLAWFDVGRETLTWTGIGNVEGLVVRARAGVTPRRESMLRRGGVVGRQLPLPHAGILPVMPGDTLVFATDGVDPRFARALEPEDSLQRTADRVLADYGTGGDDALVVTVRYRGADA